MAGEQRLLSRIASLAIAAAGLALMSARAHAAETPISRRSAVGADLRWWSGDNTGSVFPIVPFVHYKVLSSLFIDAEFALAPQSGGTSLGLDDVGARLGLGNPMLGAHFASTSKSGALTGFAGVRVGIPLATFGDLHSDRANDLASASSAHADFYRWVPELLPVVGTVGLEIRPREGLWMRIPIDFMVLAPTTERRTTKGGLVTRFEIEGQSRWGVGGGGALQLVVSDGFRTRREDRAQAAMEPYFVFDNDRWFMRFAVIVAVDAPLGPGFFGGGLLASDFRVGGHLP